MKTLDELALKYGTDKSSGVHNYCQYYDNHFSPLRNERFTLVEIGVKNGASLKMWEEYFPNAKIIGVDIQKECARFRTERISIEVGDQSDEGFWEEFIIKYPEVSIVIDDGGHKSDQQQITMEYLYTEFTTFYCIEDLQVAHYNRFRSPDFAITTEVLADMFIMMHRTAIPNELHSYPGLCILGGLQ